MALAVTKELDAAKKDNPAAIERNFLILGPSFCWAFFDFLLTGPLAGEINAESLDFSERKVTIAAISVKLSYARTTDVLRRMYWPIRG